jgi:hypothetical protein
LIGGVHIGVKTLLDINLIWLGLSQWEEGSAYLPPFPLEEGRRSAPCGALNSHWLQGKCVRTNLSQAAAGMILKDQRRVPVRSVKITALGPLKRITGSIFKISKEFQRSKQV